MVRIMDLAAIQPVVTQQETDTVQEAQPVQQEIQGAAAAVEKANDPVKPSRHQINGFS